MTPPTRELFCFASHGSIFTRTDAGRRGVWIGAPPGPLISSASYASRKSDVFCACGPDDALIAVWEKEDGGYDQVLRNIPLALKDWLLHPLTDAINGKRDLKTLRVALGPNGSFVAFDAVARIWGGVHDALVRRLQDSSLPAPNCVALGLDGNLIYADVDGGGAVDLGVYPKLQPMLYAESTPLQCAALSCVRKGDFFISRGLVGKTSSMSFDVPLVALKGTLDFVSKLPSAHGGTIKWEKTIEQMEREELQAADEELGKLRAQQDGWENEKAKCAKEKTDLEAENVRLTMAATDLTRKKTETESQLSELQATVSVLRMQKVELESALRGMQSANQSLSVANQDLKRAKSSQDLTAAQAIVQANNVANRDFALRQRLQARQWNAQTAMTGMLNMQTMSNATMLNIASGW